MLLTITLYVKVRFWKINLFTFSDRWTVAVPNAPPLPTGGTKTLLSVNERGVILTASVG